MFIKEITKKNPGYEKPFVYRRLVESVRTPRGPRHQTLLNLGTLDIPSEEWKSLANRIEEILTGQQSLFAVPPHIETLASHYAGMLRQKEMSSMPVAEEKPVWEMLDVNSLNSSEFRSVGGEIVGSWAFEKLGFPGLLEEIGLDKEQIDRVALLIIGRLLHSDSERETARWGKEISGLGELWGADYRHLSNNALYRIPSYQCAGISSAGLYTERTAQSWYSSSLGDGAGSTGQSHAGNYCRYQPERGAGIPEADWRPGAISSADLPSSGDFSSSFGYQTVD